MRLARLERAGLVARERVGVWDARLVAGLTPRGASALGEPRRKPAVIDASRVEHELAGVDLVMLLERELAASGDQLARVLTERECRQAEAAGEARYSVRCEGAAGGALCWPDVVVEFGNGRRRAFEIEFAAKPSKRLRAIVGGYRDHPRYPPLRNVVVLVRSPALAARLAGIVVAQGARPSVTVKPWPLLEPAARDAVHARLTALADDPPAAQAA